MVAAAQVVEGTGFRAAAVRSALTLIEMALRPPYAMKIFSDASSGARWLSSELEATAAYAPDAGQLIKVVHELRSRLNAPASLETDADDPGEPPASQRDSRRQKTFRPTT
jgi:hypothetical protein